MDEKIIRNKYGEAMWHYCRTHFSTILEIPGLLSKILLNKFASSKNLYSELEKSNQLLKFKNIIYSECHKERTQETGELKSPDVLLEQAGYILYECKTEEQIQEFRKYYYPGEEICTFDDCRLRTCYVYFAVKKDVENIKRKDFETPRRQDLYGTSVISIQFTKDPSHTLSIKNRYNHKVENSDATFSNDLDNIIPGLTDSFEYYYGMKQQHKKEELSGFVMASNGKYYRYNYAIGDVYYCSDNIIIDNYKVVDTFEQKERYIVMDYFILDLKEKRITLYEHELEDSFIDFFQEIIDIKITKKVFNKEIIVETNNGEALIEIDSNNRIIRYENNNLKELNTYFLSDNIYLEILKTPNVELINNCCLESNIYLKDIDIQSVKEIKGRFLKSNKSLRQINLPNLIKVGNDFLFYNEILSSVFLPNLTFIGNNFLNFNKKLIELKLPSVEIIQTYFLSNNDSLKNLYLPNVKMIESFFMDNNPTLESISLPNVEKIENCFLMSNKILSSIHMPLVKYIGDKFLYSNLNLKKISLESVLEIGFEFLCNNTILDEIYVPNIERKGFSFLRANQIINKDDIAKEGKKIHY